MSSFSDMVDYLVAQAGGMAPCVVCGALCGLRRFLWFKDAAHSEHLCIQCWEWSFRVINQRLLGRNS